VIAYQSPGSPSGFVNDFAEMIPDGAQAELETRLTQFKEETSNEIAIATVPTLGGDTIENFANKLFREWGIGTEANDNGILILLARDERELRIEVGYGLEGAVPDILAGRIVREDMIPRMQAGEPAAALDVAVTKLIAASKGEYIAEPEPKTVPFESLGMLPLFLFIVLIRIFSATKSWWFGGVIGGVGGLILGIVVTSFVTGLIFGGVGLVVGLILDFIVSKFGGRGRGGPWINSGGWGGGGFGSGGGFGGFGGGSSGGGGASGKW